MVNKFCGFMHLEKGCIFIAVIGLATSGIIFVIHENLWTVLSLALSVVSGGFLLAGAIKYTRISIIIYVLFEILHITEMFAACVIIFVDLIALRKFECNTNCHCYWVAFGNWNTSHVGDGDSYEKCEKEGIILGCFFWTYILADIYFLKCAYNLLMKTHLSKSDSTASLDTAC